MKFLCIQCLQASRSFTFVAISCGPPPVLENGRVDTSQGTFLNNFAYYSCDPGYNLTGCSNARCLSTGQWSCDSPFCAGEIPHTISCLYTYLILNILQIM